MAAAGALSLAAGGQTAGTAAPAGPIKGPVLAWLAIGTAGGARLRLYELDASGQPRRVLGGAAFAARAVSDAVASANRAALAHVAAGLGAPEAECAQTQGAMLHVRSGRRVPFAMWVDFDHTGELLA